jgi:hypothetical protein
VVSKNSWINKAHGVFQWPSGATPATFTSRFGMQLLRAGPLGLAPAVSKGRSQSGWCKGAKRAGGRAMRGSDQWQCPCELSGVQPSPIASCDTPLLWFWWLAPDRNQYLLGAATMFLQFSCEPQGV